MTNRHAGMKCKQESGIRKSDAGLCLNAKKTCTAFLCAWSPNSAPTGGVKCTLSTAALNSSRVARGFALVFFLVAAFVTAAIIRPAFSPSNSALNS